MATKKLTCTADVSISQKYPGNAYNAADRLAFGAGDASGDAYYALLKFSALGLDSSLYKVTKAVLTLTKITGALGFNSSFSVRALRITSNWSESTTYNTRPNTTTTGASAASSVGSGHSGTVSLDVTDIVKSWLAGSGQYGVQIEKTTAGGSLIKCIADRTSSSAAYITVTYEQRIPAPTTPVVSAPGTITAASKAFSWTASSDNVFTSSELSYQLQVSLDNGSTWSSSYAASAGTTKLSVNLRTLAGLKSGQFYYNKKLKVRVRAVTPSFNGKVYYSSWGVSSAGVIDYRVVPSAPAGLSVAPSSTYEGETVTITLSRPASYNTYDSSGAAMQLTYTVKLKDGTTLGSVTAAATSATVSLAVAAPSITAGMSNLSTSITATVKDAEGQSSPATSAVTLTIKRYRRPALTVTDIDRASKSAVITVQITDTGYGGSQTNSQIAKFEFSLAGGAWQTITPTWSGLKTTITITGLTSGSRYTLKVRVTNAAPIGVTAKTGTVTDTILEFSPAAMIYHDSANGATGAAVKALIVGEDWSHVVDEGNAYVEGSLSVGDLVVRGGWVDLTLDAAFSLYSGTTAYRPMYRVCGNVVTVKGVLAPTDAFESGSTPVTMASGIPEEFCPSRALYFVCQGSGMNRWTCSVRIDGTVCIERYGVTEAITVPASAWLPFCVTYMI